MRFAIPSNSSQPIAQRVAEVLDNMSLADEITIVQGAGTTNPYVFYMPGIPSLCIPALGEEDGPLVGRDGERFDHVWPGEGVTLVAEIAPMAGERAGGAAAGGR